jgi:hypothetical protein
MTSEVPPMIEEKIVEEKSNRQLKPKKILRPGTGRKYFQLE